jgi:methylglyoxal synthase
MSRENLEKHKRIALVAHDNQKQEILDWAIKNKANLLKHQLFATGTTGTLLEKALDVKITKFMSGPLGGDQQLGAAIAEGKLDMLIFFWDPMAAQPHEPDIRALLRLGQVWNIPIATNSSTADFIISSPLLDEDYKINLPDFSKYIERKI